MFILKQTTVEFDGINASPFCAKVELFLRYHQIPFKIEAALPMHGPYKKIPFAVYQGETLGDSELILQRLINDYAIDEGLTSLQQSQGYAWQMALEQHLYWLMVYCRWHPEASWKILEQAFFSGLKWPARPFIAKQSRKLVLKNLYSQGVGRFSLKQVLQAAEQCFVALEAHLSKNTFICGDTFSRFDLFAYAIVKNIDNHDMPTPLASIIEGFSQLKLYQARVEQALKNKAGSVHSLTSLSA
ncbi:glutathione S-transferase N-terminal domain-containing protein [Motilimonas cestriensis]|uniref:Glutathione S-transferase N-terminal domain-containing protein n=1 Tax=Motilimonas cestriensis TaxID=2742685 RepID=A0ABS8W842_9GAMM|nr:glutathione S-transferase family protein [Motilimonas cestriensis]MCE2593696.1 glutathione S-transferase N-terminal domain-containing protein [Motilimonas cestriensis]